MTNWFDKILTKLLLNFSVGMSWLAQRAGGIPGSRELISGALENLKASILGLAGVKCEVVYPAC